MSFQRKLEPSNNNNPFSSDKIDSSEGWNLLVPQQHMSFQRKLEPPNDNYPICHPIKSVQVKAESPDHSHPICHPITIGSSESWNLPIITTLFQAIKSVRAKLDPPDYSHPICLPIIIGTGESWNLPLNLLFRETWNNFSSDIYPFQRRLESPCPIPTHVIPTKVGTSLTICHPIKSVPSKSGTFKF